MSAGKSNELEYVKDESTNMSSDSPHRHEQVFNFSCLKPKIQKDCEAPLLQLSGFILKIKSKHSLALLPRDPASLFDKRLMKSLFLLRVEQVVLSSSGNSADLSLIVP